MKISPKNAIGIALLPIAALLLSGCGSQTASSTPASPQSAQTSASQSVSAAPAPSAASQATPVATAAQVEAQLPPLPADNQQAIDAQLNSIDKDVSATATTTNGNDSTDLSNANLGL